MTDHTVKFTPIRKELTRKLIEFFSVHGRKPGDSILIDGETYTLDYVSISKSSFFRSRGLSIYFRNRRSVIRISDHWSASKGYPRSHKLNCGFIDNQYWTIGRSEKQHICKHAGRFPFEVLAGKAGLNKLNKHCDHWSSSSTQ